MLFVGGPLHGQDLDVLPAAGTTELPPVFTDLKSGERWQQFVMRHPDHPTLIRRVYLHASLTTGQGLPQAVGDAVLRQWFATGTPEEPPVPVLANGHKATAYFVTCADCDHANAPYVFGSLKERAGWVSAHRDEEGHTNITFSQVEVSIQDTEEVTTDGNG